MFIDWNPAAAAPDEEHHRQRGGEVRRCGQQHQAAAEGEAGDRLDPSRLGAAGAAGHEQRHAHRTDGRHCRQRAVAGGTLVEDRIGEPWQERHVGEADHHDEERRDDQQGDIPAPADVGEAVAELCGRRPGGDVGRVAGRKTHRHGKGNDRKHRRHEVHASRADPGDADGDPGNAGPSTRVVLMLICPSTMAFGSKSRPTS